MEDEYDIKKIFEDIELELIKSMKRTLWSHQQDEEAKKFRWSQWQAIKLKQFEDYKKENKKIFDNYSNTIFDNYVYKSLKKQFKEGASKTNKKAIKAGIIRKEDSRVRWVIFWIKS